MILFFFILALVGIYGIVFLLSSWLAASIAPSAHRERALHDRWMAEHKGCY